MIIYKITNLVNGKVYVGQTRRTLEKRKQQHLKAAKSGVNTHIYNAIRKHGEDNFKFEKICDVENEADLNVLEQYYISLYDSVKRGYNMIDHDYNNVMAIDSVKEKHLKRMQSAETRTKISNSMKAYRLNNPFTEEHRKHLSESAMGNHNFGTGDTRSIGCYCVLEDGSRFDFHSYRDAWKWWSKVENPFNTSAECIYQRKIKQSIEDGYFTYGKDGIKYLYPKWYRGGGVNEKVN